jgi:hypothetical protein
VWITSPTELIDEKCSMKSGRLEWAIFTNSSRLVRIEQSAFRGSRSHDSVVSLSIDMSGPFFFYLCGPLFSAHLNHCRNLCELQGMPSMKVDCMIWSFHQLLTRLARSIVLGQLTFLNHYYQNS